VPAHAGIDVDADGGGVLTLLSTPFALPPAAILRSDGRQASSSALHEDGPTLVLIGHRTCKTTRQTIPFIDRIHKDGGRAVLLMQDTPEDAMEALVKLNATIPFFLEPDPYVFSAAIGLVTVPTLLFVESDGRVSTTSEAFRRPDIDAFAARLGAPRPVIENDPMGAFKPG